MVAGHPNALRGPLPLLPSGPGGVHGSTVIRTRPPSAATNVAAPESACAGSGAALELAEREGFEPSVRLPVHSISNAAPSASRSSLQKSNVQVGRPPRASGGEGGIRTLGTRERTTDFESAAFDHSATSPHLLKFGFNRKYPWPQRVLDACLHEDVEKNRSAARSIHPQEHLRSL